MQNSERVLAVAVVAIQFFLISAFAVTTAHAADLPGHLIVQKTTAPAGIPTVFSITATGTGIITGSAVGSVNDATDYDYEVTAGTYSVTETVPTGWEQTGNTCLGVSVSAGQTVTCTITNRKFARLVIVKNANGGADTFGFTIGGDISATPSITTTGGSIVTPSTGSFGIDIFAGSYTVNETTMPAGWAFASVNCGGPTLFTPSSGGLSIGAGVTVTCTFVNTKTAIPAASITVNQAGKTYGDADPVFTGTLSGFAPSDGVTATYVRTAGEAVGTYTISATLAPTSVLANYTITNTPATFTINKRPITIIADNKSKVAGSIDPALTYQITAGTLVGSDLLSGALSRVAGETVGTYSIIQSTLTAGVNYLLSFVPGTFTVTAPAGGSISGVKFNDLNRNRIKDAGEPLLSGWTIRLKNKDNTVIRTTVTNASGAYSFTGLPAGIYKVKETHQRGWKRMTKNPPLMTITTTSVMQNVDFGNAKKLTSEYEDTTADDDRDEF